MRRLLPYLACVALATADPPAAVPVAGEEGERVEAAPQARQRTVSSSRQFVVHGSDFKTRDAIASLAEETRAALVKQVGEGGEWKHTIAMELHGAQGDKAPPRLMRSEYLQVPNGFRLQLDIHLAKGKPPGLERSLLELLLIERGLRDKGPEPLEGILSIPPFLLDGLLESIRWSRGQRDRGFYASLFEKDALMSEERLLGIEEPEQMDGGLRAAYRASSGALVMALLGQPGGKESMGRLLEKAAAFEGEEKALLMEHFPGMNLGKASLAKWWGLQLARMAETPFTQVLTIAETEEELSRLLSVRFKDAAGGDIAIPAAKFRDLLALPIEQRGPAIEPVMERASVFLYRAFPEHRRIILSYLQILAEIAADKDDNAEQRLEELAQQRIDLLRLGKRTRDYLDWYRITSAKELSGEFGEYIKLKESLESATRRKRGPVSDYLKDMQRAYEEE